MLIDGVTDHPAGLAGRHSEEDLLLAAGGGVLEQLHKDNMAALESNSGFLLELLLEPG